MKLVQEFDEQVKNLTNDVPEVGLAANDDLISDFPGTRFTAKDDQVSFSSETEKRLFAKVSFVKFHC